MNETELGYKIIDLLKDMAPEKAFNLLAKVAMAYLPLMRKNDETLSSTEQHTNPSGKHHTAIPSH